MLCHLFLLFLMSSLANKLIPGDINADIEDVAQQLIEDNIVAVSRQMIDKEASLARETSKNGMQSELMDVEEEL